MKRAELGQRIQRELKGMIRIGPFVFALLVVMILLWRTDSVANSGLFQSSPVQTPATSTSTPTIEVSVTATSSQQLTVMPSPDATGTTEIPTTTPEVTLAPTELPVTDTPAAALPSETAEPGETEDEDLRYPEGESDLRFEWGMLFDSLALFFSYAWLFCGILLFIAVPLLFFILWRSSAQRQEEATPEEGTPEEVEQQQAQQEE